MSVSVRICDFSAISQNQLHGPSEIEAGEQGGMVGLSYNSASFLRLDFNPRRRRIGGKNLIK